jgi:hypothetical protein
VFEDNSNHTAALYNNFSIKSARGDKIKPRERRMKRKFLSAITNRGSAMVSRQDEAEAETLAHSTPAAAYCMD